MILSCVTLAFLTCVLRRRCCGEFEFYLSGPTLVRKFNWYVLAPWQ